MGSIADNLAEIRGRIDNAAARAGRKGDHIRLVAVSKKKPPELIMEAFEAGQRVFGENYAQEFKTKTGQLPDEIECEIEWHFIGALQRNKVKMVVNKVAMIQSVDKISLAREIDNRVASPVEVLIEVNIGEEHTKAGTAVGEAKELIEASMDLANIDVRGLMTMPPFFDDPERARPFFVRLRELRDSLRKSTGLALDELSMGMSGDYEAAIEEGATIIRVGTAIFGERNYR